MGKSRVKTHPDTIRLDFKSQRWGQRNWAAPEVAYLRYYSAINYLN